MDPIRPELEKLAAGNVLARLEALEKAAKKDEPKDEPKKPAAQPKGKDKA